MCFFFLFFALDERNVYIADGYSTLISSLATWWTVLLRWPLGGAARLCNTVVDLSILEYVYMYLLYLVSHSEDPEAWHRPAKEYRLCVLCVSVCFIQSRSSLLASVNSLPQLLSTIHVICARYTCFISALWYSFDFMSMILC